MNNASCFLGYVHAQSRRGVLFQDHFWHIPVWLPKKYVDMTEDPFFGEVMLRLASWLVNKRGIKEFMEMGAEELAS